MLIKMTIFLKISKYLTKKKTFFLTKKNSLFSKVAGCRPGTLTKNNFLKDIFQRFCSNYKLSILNF